MRNLNRYKCHFHYTQNPRTLESLLFARERILIVDFSNSHLNYLRPPHSTPPHAAVQFILCFLMPKALVFWQRSARGNICYSISTLTLILRSFRSVGFSASFLRYRASLTISFLRLLQWWMFLLIFFISSEEEEICSKDAERGWHGMACCG